MKTNIVVMHDTETILSEEIIEMAKGLLPDLSIVEAESTMANFEPILWKGMNPDDMREHILAIKAVLDGDAPVDEDDLEMTDDEDYGVDSTYHWLGYGHIDRYLTHQEVLKVFKRILTGLRNGFDPDLC